MAIEVILLPVLAAMVTALFAVEYRGLVASSGRALLKRSVRTRLRRRVFLLGLFALVLDGYLLANLFAA